MKRTINHHGISLEYEFTPKPVKNINLRVRSDGSVAVSAPRWVTKGQVEEFLLARWDWLIKTRAGNLGNNMPQFGWQDGETFHLLGQPITVKHQSGSKNAAQLQENILRLTLDTPNSAQKVGEKWYDTFCVQQTALLEERVWSRFRSMGTERPTLRLRWMTSRWGSCMSKQGVITLNKRLFSLPPHLAEYVLLHEYCHLLHPDHQSGFYSLLEEFVPHRKQLDKQLKSGAYRFVR
ncbi:MAG: M48 family metallopeptidase [Oscillospiraceae bacterium]|nr:M48 family metallopeptidase [Oscillospiraceae bacterium]